MPPRCEALTRAGHIADVLGCSIAMADMELRLGRLRDAERTLARALELAEANVPAGATVMRGTADMLVGLSRVAWYRNDLAGVAERLRRSDELGEAASLAQNPYRWRVADGAPACRRGRPAAALELLDEAERVYVGDYSPNVQPIHALRARVLAARGDVAEALAWAREHQVSRRRRADLPTRVRAHHARPGPARRARRDGVRGEPAPRPWPSSTGCSSPPRTAAASGP